MTDKCYATVDVPAFRIEMDKCCCEKCHITREFILDTCRGWEEVVQEALAIKASALATFGAYSITDWHLTKLSSEGQDVWLMVVELEVPCDFQDPGPCHGKELRAS